MANPKSLNVRAYIGIGSNLEQPLAQVKSACKVLAAHPHITLVDTSPWYQSKAVGPGSQPDYVNGAGLLNTALAPEELLDALQAIELAHGRERSVRWGARTLDLDILLIETLTQQTPRLTVPHPRMTERNFVLQPLLDLNPTLQLPDGRHIDHLLNIIGTQDLAVIKEGH